MRTWLVIYEEYPEIKTKIIMANIFEEVLEELTFLSRYADIKGVFEVVR